MLATVPTTRRAILVALKRSGGMRAQDLAHQLGITVAAVRQQLGRLDEDGLVSHRRDGVEGRGRPTHRYELTPSAEALFPKRYGDLTTELLGLPRRPGAAIRCRTCSSSAGSAGCATRRPAWRR